MNEKIEAKINQIRARVTAPLKPDDVIVDRTTLTDPLSRSIRNQKEADDFFAEMDRIVNASKK